MNCLRHVKVDREHREAEQWGERDFGYSIRPEFRGRGLGSEALAAVIDYCFSVLGIGSFFGETMPDNAASARAMQKAGMQAVGTAGDGHIVFRIKKRSEAPDCKQLTQKTV